MSLLRIRDENGKNIIEMSVLKGDKWDDYEKLFC